MRPLVVPRLGPLCSSETYPHPPAPLYPQKRTSQKPQSMSAQGPLSDIRTKYECDTAGNVQMIRHESNIGTNVYFVLLKNVA
jgi:hypothetical protein